MIWHKVYNKMNGGHGPVAAGSSMTGSSRNRSVEPKAKKKKKKEPVCVCVCWVSIFGQCIYHLFACLCLYAPGLCVYLWRIDCCERIVKINFPTVHLWANELCGPKSKIEKNIDEIRCFRKHKCIIWNANRHIECGCFVSRIDLFYLNSVQFIISIQ